MTNFPTWLRGPTVVILLTTPISGVTPRPNLSGIWSLDMATSKFGQLLPPDSNTLTIVHADPRIQIVSVQKTKLVETTKTVECTTDGRKTRNRIRTVEGDKDTDVECRWRGEDLVASYALPHAGHTDDYQDVFSLADQGKSLEITRKVGMPDRREIQHQFSMVLRFNRGF